MMNSKIFYLIIFVFCTSCYSNQEETSKNNLAVPVIDGEFWRLAAAPDLDSLNGSSPEAQQVVDHGFVKDIHGNWQLWACIRGTKVGRLLYGWEGASLTDRELWIQKGVVARASSEWGEGIKGTEEKIQAPYFMKIDDTYYCFYNSNGIRIMTSKDGVNFEREKFINNNNVLFDKGGRDVMVMKADDLYYAYSTISTISKDNWPRGFVSVRTSKNLKTWSDYTVVSEGGRAGNGNVSAESPFVLKYKDAFYLFRSSSSTRSTFVYRSKDPYNFGVGHDDNIVAELPVWAPEIIIEDGQWYISDLGDFQGVMLAKLKWEEQ